MRYYFPISLDDFKNKVGAYITINNGSLLDFILDDSKIYKDIKKVEFDFENFEYLPETHWWMNKFLGYHLIDNDFPILMCYAGGDWEHPVIFILYWDGKHIRGYVPKDGNCWNYKTKQAFGNDEEADEAFIRKQWHITDNTWDEHIDQMYSFPKILLELKDHIQRKV